MQQTLGLNKSDYYEKLVWLILSFLLQATCESVVCHLNCWTEQRVLVDSFISWLQKENKLQRQLINQQRISRLSDNEILLLKPPEKIASIFWKYQVVFGKKHLPFAILHFFFLFCFHYDQSVNEMTFPSTGYWLREWVCWWGWSWAGWKWRCEGSVQVDEGLWNGSAPPPLCFLLTWWTARHTSVGASAAYPHISQYALMLIVHTFVHTFVWCVRTKAESVIRAVFVLRLHQHILSSICASLWYRPHPPHPALAHGHH